MKISLYWILFLGQTIGFAGDSSPRGLLKTRLRNGIVFGALGVTIIQVCYWLDQCWFATLRMGYNALLGHVILFLSRLNFRFSCVFRTSTGAFH